MGGPDERGLRPVDGIDGGDDRALRGARTHGCGFHALSVPAVINALFFWVPIVILAVLFPILTALGVAEKTTETREAVRLSLH